MSDLALPAPARSVGLVLHDLARLFRKRFEQVARARHLGLTRAQAAVIIHLSRNEGINQVSLAQIMELEPITLVRLLDRLQSAGLVERRAHPLDRRARILFLTPAARPLLTRIEILGDEVRREAMTGFSAAECEAFFQMAVAMKSNLIEHLADYAEDAPVESPEEAVNG